MSCNPVTNLDVSIDYEFSPICSNKYISLVQNTQATVKIFNNTANLSTFEISNFSVINN